MKKQLLILFMLACVIADGTAFASGTIALPSTGQTLCYDASDKGMSIPCAGTGQDGELKKGMAWPNPRFTDNSNGTVTDNLTGLVWLKNANCFGMQGWRTALASANSLSAPACGLTDGSTAGQWRLPNRKELASLIDRNNVSPALPKSYPFTNVQYYYQSYNYWSSSAYPAVSTTYAWSVDMNLGSVIYHHLSDGYYVWPVRDR